MGINNILMGLHRGQIKVVHNLLVLKENIKEVEQLDVL